MENYQLNTKELIFCFGFGLILGILLTILYFNINPKVVFKCLDGLWTRNNCGFEGSWVHVNINNITYARAVEVCKHEVGHEIFAEICEKNISKCLKIR